LKKPHIEEKLRLKENIETLKPILANISMEDVIKSIREDREKR